MLQFLAIALVAAAVFGLCFLADKLFTRLFRNKPQHKTGLSVRAGKRYGVFGVVFSFVGVASIVSGSANSEGVLLWGGLIVLLLGIGLSVHYLSFGIYYDDDHFLVCRFGKKSVLYAFQDICRQQLFLISGGSVVIELDLADGSSVSVQSNMEGAYPFLDAAFAAWCRQKGISPDSCTFHDPAKSWWFPHEEKE